MFGISGARSAALRSGRARLGVRRALNSQSLVAALSSSLTTRDGCSAQFPRTSQKCFKSTVPERDPQEEIAERPPNSEVISFPTVDGEGQPVLLNAQEHAVGYLSKILNARVYDVAKETQLQEAKNLSAVSTQKLGSWILFS